VATGPATSLCVAQSSTGQQVFDYFLWMDAYSKGSESAI